MAKLIKALMFQKSLILRNNETLVHHETLFLYKQGKQSDSLLNQILLKILKRTHCNINLMKSLNVKSRSGIYALKKHT